MISAVEDPVVGESVGSSVGEIGSDAVGCNDVEALESVALLKEMEPPTLVPSAESPSDKKFTSLMSTILFEGCKGPD